MLFIIVTGTVVGFAYTPISPPNVFHDPGSVSNMWQYKHTNASIFVENIGKTIPKGAVLVTQNDVYPFFSQNMNSYETPWSPGMNSFNVTKFQFLIANYGSGWVYTAFPSMYSLINKALNTGQYGVYASGYGIIVLEKGYKSSPVYFVPMSSVMSSSSIYPAENSSAFYNGNVLSLANTTNGTGFFGTGFNLITPGSYSLSIVLTSTNFSKSNRFTLNVSDGLTGTLFLSRNISASTLDIANGLATLNYTFTSKLVYNDVTISGQQVYWNGTVSIDKIVLKQLST